MTDALVLAAGVGRRLLANRGRPKWLVPVADGCPAGMQLQSLARQGAGRVVVVVGPGRDEIEREVEPWRDRLSVELVPNPHFADRNNWYSFLIGLDVWLLTGGDELVVINSDVYARPEWFVATFAALSEASAPGVLAIDPSRGKTAEAMKVGLDLRGDQVVNIGKTGIHRPDGEFVGVALWSRSSALELREILAGFLGDRERRDQWYEHGIQEHLDAGARYIAVAVPDDRWVEIDDDDDLRLAHRLVHDRFVRGTE